MIVAVVALASAQSVIDPPPAAKEWADLAKLPDWSGTWTPSIMGQEKENKANPPSWTAKAAKQILQMEAEEKAGRPRPLFVDCLPQGMPTWMLITHNAIEFLFTPGRVTMLGEVDGNRMRRIYTDGRKHPADPDLTFHGHSVGRWEGETLAVDTVGVLPQAYIAIAEAVGIPNNGDLHVVEHIHLTGPDTLRDDLEITAPRVLAKTWSTQRIFYRQRNRKFEVAEGVCRQGDFEATTDREGNAIFRPLPAAQR